MKVSWVATFLYKKYKKRKVAIVMEGTSIVTTLGGYVTQMLAWVGDVFEVISGNELALFLICIPVLFVVVKFAKYLLGI